MGDFIRYLFTAESDLTLESIAGGFKTVDPAFSIFLDAATGNSGDLIYGGEIYGELEFNRRGDQVFDEDIEDLREQIVAIGMDSIDDLDSDDEGFAAVEQALISTSGMIALQLSEAGHEHYQRIDLFWDWLFERYPGLLQIDEEGYYSQDEQILAVD